MDGTGSPGVVGDVAIADGRVVAMGPTAAGGADSAATIDATGLVVSPGFVDIHTHYDAQVLWDRMMTVSPWHGVTTVVMGNCGFGVAPTRPANRELIIRTLEKVEGMSAAALRAGLGEDWPFETFPQYLDAVEARGPAINVAAMIGHTPVRLEVMGEESTERAATDDEIARMRGATTSTSRSWSRSIAPDDLWQTDPDECCAMRKVEPLARALEGKQAWMTGLRRVEAPTRANAPIVSSTSAAAS